MKVKKQHSSEAGLITSKGLLTETFIIQSHFQEYNLKLYCAKKKKETTCSLWDTDAAAYDSEEYVFLEETYNISLLLDHLFSMGN